MALLWGNSFCLFITDSVDGTSFYVFISAYGRMQRCWIIYATTVVWLWFSPRLLRAITALSSVRTPQTIRAQKKMKELIRQWEGCWWSLKSDGIAFELWNSGWNAATGGIQPYVTTQLLYLARDSWSDCSCSTELGTNQSKAGNLLGHLGRSQNNTRNTIVSVSLWRQLGICQELLADMKSLSHGSYYLQN